MRILSFLTVCLLWSMAAIAQQETTVCDASGSLLSNAWAGGMNACQYAALEIDGDGVADLLVFDRHGNRIMPFIWENNGYSYAPGYVQNFPELFNWAIFADYDGDGLKDIFTYSPGFASMMVYRNVSVASLAFERVVYPYLTSFQGGGYVNILVTYADYPGIYDIDGDGDLDILTFWGLGAFVEWHKNLSMEKYGHADSLDYEKVDLCWGRFAESEESNLITLDTCFGGDLATGSSRLPHTGSTFFTEDLNDDGVVDLVLGDVDYPNLIFLANGGTGSDAVMISQDPAFPSSTTPVQLFSMPSATSVDVDHDGLPDLLVSPFDPNLFSPENKESSWYYRNSSTSFPQYDLMKKDFLQDEMIDVGSGACPVWADYDNDGLLDLFIGNFGYYDTSYYDQFMNLQSEYVSQLALFLNNGSAQQPAFTLVSDDFAGLSSMELVGIYPAFADIDDDGDKDMVVGVNDGPLLYFENIAPEGSPMELVYVEPWNSVDVGRFSAPAFADLDHDGHTDLVVGEMDGNLNYYRNQGIPGTFSLEFVTDSLGKVNVTDYNVSLSGFSRPSFFTDKNGHLGLLVGSEHGKVYQFTDIEENLAGEFTETDSLFNAVSEPWQSADRGLWTAAAAADLRDNGQLDLVVGNFSGGLEYFSSEAIPGVDLRIGEQGLSSMVSVFPNPAWEVLYIRLEKNEGYEITLVELKDLNGRTVMAHHPSKETIEISVKDLQQGTYICRVWLSEGGSDVPVNRKVVVLGRGDD